MVLETVSLAAVLVLAFVLYMYKRAWDENRRLSRVIEGLHFDKKSLSVKHGKVSEQFMPFMQSYPYNKENFRFIGSPIDGMQFEDDRVVFVEFKTGDSRLSAKQESVKSLVNDKKVEFREIRIG